MPAEERKMIETLYFSREGAEHAIANLSAIPLADAVREQVIADMLRGDDGAKLAWPRQSMLEDISAEVSNIAVPTLVIAGEADTVDPPGALQAEVVQRIPGAMMRIVPRTGHLSPLEAPADLAKAIRNLASRLAA